MLKRIHIVAAFIILAGATSALAEKDKTGSAKAFAFEHVSCTGGENEIHIIIDRVKGTYGLITADLYPNKEEGFLRGSGRLLQVRFAAKAPQTKFCIHAPESGLFAISVYHDENANGEFDKHPIGLPAEPWGISNNPKARFRAPPIEKALFEVNPETGANLFIKLN